MPRRLPHPAWVLVPAIAAVGGHCGFAALVLRKWQAFEVAAGGQALVFGNTSTAHTGAADVGPAWGVVVAPAWAGEAVVAGIAAMALRCGIGSSMNTRLIHANSLLQAFMNSVFKLFLLVRLVRETGSWLWVFSPIYTSIVLQLALHYRKTPDTRNRRPGFPIGMPHLLALVVSFKLAGVFEHAQQESNPRSPAPAPGPADHCAPRCRSEGRRS
jgi:hypothetical protein